MTGPEHVPAEDPGADVLETARGEVFVDARGPFVLAEHRLLEGAGRDEPAMELPTADTERMVTVLTGTRAAAINGDGEAVDS